MDARILGREVAAARLHRARQAPAAREHDRDDRARREARQRTSSQWPLGPGGRSSTSLPPIVLIATSMRPSLSASAAASPRPFRRSVPAASTPVGVAVRPCASGREHAHRLGVGREVRDRDRAGGEHEVGRAGVREVDPRRAPAGEAGAERRVERRAARSRTRRSRALWRYAADGSLRELVTKRPTRPSRTSLAMPMPGERVGDAARRCALLEAEAEPARIGARHRRATARSRRARSDPRRSRRRGRGGRRR